MMLKSLCLMGCLSLILFIASNCNKNPTPQKISQLQNARDQARLVMERHCGDCHIPESPRALSRALAVYNLRQEEWAKNMGESQLKQIPERLQEAPFFDPFDMRDHDRQQSSKPTKEEVEIVKNYGSSWFRVGEFPPF